MDQNVQDYEIRKNRLVKEITRGSDNRKKWSLVKSTSNLFRPRSTSKQNHHINLTRFNKVLRVDKDNLIAEVEGLTTYEALVAETLKYSCLPTVVPELKTITVGGAVAGCGIESSSFRYGLVHEGVKEMDVFLSSGNVVTCNAHNEYRDLFTAMPNTFGTLGYVIKVDLQLMQAKTFVKLRHILFSDPEEFFSNLAKFCEENRDSGSIDFIEGVIFENDEMYITLGTFADDAPYTSQYTFKNIYYRSIREKEIDYLTTHDYIWRWDPDWFWCSHVFFMQNPLMRLLFGKWMLHSASYAKIMHFFNRHHSLKTFLEAVEGPKESIIQDIAIPIDNASTFLEFFQKDIGIKPIWVCPTKSSGNALDFDFCELYKEQLYLDFGFWDAVTSDKEPGFYNRKIEEITQSLQGFKSLYSTSYYTEEEFWDLYDRKKYMRLKKKYDPKAHFRDFFEKCSM